MKIRIKFSKTGPIKFIGHLDLMRTLQKVFRRADIPIAYSEGFNPHMLFSIGAPLGVGIESASEYLDMKLAKDCEVLPLLQAIQKECPRGIQIIGGVILDEKEPAAMAIISLSKYTISQVEPTITNELIQLAGAKEEIIVEKKTKKGRLKEVNIKEGIHNLSIVDGKIIMANSTGSVLNIKPEVVLKALCDLGNVEFNPYNYKYFREELYHGTENFQALSVPVKETEHGFVVL